MARGRKPNRNCVWVHDNQDNEFEEWCENDKHKRKSTKIEGTYRESHFHYRCRYCKEVTDDFTDYKTCPNEYCDLYRVVIESMKEVNSG